MRKARNIVKNAQYHVGARANRKELILETRKMKELFYKIIIRAKKRYRFDILNFCIMGNHFHIIIRPGEHEQLSRIMQWILSVFAIHYNKRIRENGHVWYDRFWSKPLDDIRQFVAVFGYIAKNPVKAGIVDNKDQYEFSGIRHFQKRDYSVLAPPSLLLQLLFPEVVFRNLLP